MNAYMGVEVQLHPFLTSALDGNDQVHCPADLPQGEGPPISGWLQSRSGQFGEGNIQLTMPGFVNIMNISVHSKNFNNILMLGAFRQCSYVDKNMCCLKYFTL
jgi:hypothetical protein